MTARSRLRLRLVARFTSSVDTEYSITVSLTILSFHRMSSVSESHHLRPDARQRASYRPRLNAAVSFTRDCDEEKAKLTDVTGL